jgi:hypothetical protein
MLSYTAARILMTAKVSNIKGYFAVICLGARLLSRVLAFQPGDLSTTEPVTHLRPAQFSVSDNEC